MSDLSTVLIPDVHGDRDALDDALIHSGSAEQKQGRLRVHDDVAVVQTGDLLDRGKQNLLVLDRLLELREQMGDRLTLLIGNHDGTLLQCMQHPEDVQSVEHWLCRLGGMKVLMNIAERFQLTLAKPSLETFPVSLSSLTSLEKVLTEVTWGNTVKKYNASSTDFPRAFEKARQLFLGRGEYASVFRAMHLACAPRPNILAVHAGVDREHCASSPEELTQQYRTLYRQKSLSVFSYSDAPFGEFIWMRRGEQPRKKLLDRPTSEALLGQEKDLLIHGHDILWGGVQEHRQCYGVRDMNGDVGMSHGYRQSPSHWGYIKIDESNSITANNDTSGEQDFGRIDDDRYVPPKR
ncbi:MAG: metallophosphoesterase [Candidatus Peregrinibacteria bacterium]|nr:metallophosphoesterase [Candidatus Peregrinibacteria bacterium]